MKVSTSQFYQQAVDVMTDKQYKLGETEVQLASGKRIIAPSDDPAASVRIMGLKDAMSKIDQYQRNTAMAESRLSLEETVLQEVELILQRVRELTVQGNNGPWTQEDRAAIATEIRQHLEGFVQLANTRDSSGEYIFSGYRIDTPALFHDGMGNFTYQGDSGQRVLKIGEDRQITTGDTADAIFMNLPRTAGGTTSLGQIFYEIASDFEAGNPNYDALADLDNALDQLVGVHTQIGARMKVTVEQKNANETFKLALDTVRSDLEDLDYAEAISKFNLQLTALQASQQSFMRIQGLNLFDFLR